MWTPLRLGGWSQARARSLPAPLPPGGRVPRPAFGRGPYTQREVTVFSSKNSRMEASRLLATPKKDCFLEPRGKKA